MPKRRKRLTPNPEPVAPRLTFCGPRRRIRWYCHQHPVSVTWLKYEYSVWWERADPADTYLCPKCGKFGERIPRDKFVGPELTAMFLALDLVKQAGKELPEPTFQEMMDHSGAKIPLDRIFHTIMYIAHEIDEFRGLHNYE